MEEKLDPMFGGVACCGWVVLVAVCLPSLSVNVDLVDGCDERGRRIIDAG